VRYLLLYPLTVLAARVADISGQYTKSQNSPSVIDLPIRGRNASISGFGLYFIRSSASLSSASCRVPCTVSDSEMLAPLSVLRWYRNWKHPGLTSRTDPQDDLRLRFFAPITFAPNGRFRTLVGRIPRELLVSPLTVITYRLEFLVDFYSSSYGFFHCSYGYCFMDLWSGSVFVPALRKSESRMESFFHPAFTWAFVLPAISNCDF